MELQEISEVESNLSESDIDPFETMYGEMDEDSFHRMMEGNDWTYSPLFCDKKFLNDSWHKKTFTEACAAIGNTRHGYDSLRTDIQTIREINDSGCTLLSEIDTMMRNMTGSSILKSTHHTSQVKPVNLSVRFILGDWELYSEDFSDSEQSKQGKFPLNLQAELQGELMDGMNIKVTTLRDTGFSKPVVNKKFYNKHLYLHKLPHYAIQSIGVICDTVKILSPNYHLFSPLMHLILLWIIHLCIISKLQLKLFNHIIHFN